MGRNSVSHYAYLLRALIKYNSMKAQIQRKVKQQNNKQKWE